MSKNIPQKVIDITGIELTPGDPVVCLGNGEQGFECVATNVTTVYFVIRSSLQKNEEENIVMGKKDPTKQTEK